MSEFMFAVALIIAAYWAGAVLRRLVDRAKERPKEPRMHKQTADMSRFGADYSGRAGILVTQSLMKWDDGTSAEAERK